MKKRIVLVIIDGFGKNENINGNPLIDANWSDIKKFIYSNPHTYLDASEEHVGLAKNEPGNSEVGHFTIGSGYLAKQPFSFIEEKIHSGQFYSNEKILSCFDYAIKNNKKIHLCGQLSDAGIHSHMNHFYPFLEIAKRLSFNNIYLHCITDGRDSKIKGACDYFKELENKLLELNVGKIATVSGRFYSMDRNENFERIRVAYDAMVSHKGKSFDDIYEYIEKEYEYLNNANMPETDEYITPAFNKSLGNDSIVSDEDVFIHINIRADRVIEFASILSSVDMQKKYLDGSEIVNLKFYSLLFHSKKINGDYFYDRNKYSNTLSKWLEKNNLSQLRIAETEKFAHITFFFDGENKYDDIENPKLKNCECILIKSPKVDSYINAPEMASKELTDMVINKMNEKRFDFTLINYANCDLVGHTADYNACIKAIEAVNDSFKRLVDWTNKNDVILILTADHGNVEQVYDDNGLIPFHTLNKVFFALSNTNVKLKKVGNLSNIAATIVELFGYTKPSYMNDSILEHEE